MEPEEATCIVCGERAPTPELWRLIHYRLGPVYAHPTHHPVEIQDAAERAYQESRGGVQITPNEGS